MEDTVIFLGNPIRFSQRLIDTFQSEYERIVFKRVGSLTELSQLTRTGQPPLMVVVEQERVASLLTNPSAYANAANGAMLVIGYYDPASLEDFIAARNKSDRFKNVGLLPLNVQMDVWISVMNLLLCGEVYYPLDLVENVVGSQQPCQMTTAENPADATLTKREWQVLALVARGMQNKSIAGELELSEHTIKLHMHNILKKLGVSNRTGAARWYDRSRAGMVPPARPPHAREH